MRETVPFTKIRGSGGGVNDMMCNFMSELLQ